MYRVHLVLVASSEVDEKTEALGEVMRPFLNVQQGSARAAHMLCQPTQSL